MRRDLSPPRGPSPTVSVALPAVLLVAALALAGCTRATIPAYVAPFQSHILRPISAENATPAPRGGSLPPLPEGTSPTQAPELLSTAAAIAAKGGLITDLPGMAAELDASAQSLQVIPSSSQQKADRIAKEWASDAQQLYVIWAYWKLPALSITRHAYYSPSKGLAFKVEFTLSSLFAKSWEEPADGFDQATLILREARDRHAVGVKEAHAIAKRMGYVPNTYGAAVLLDIVGYGPLWVFADMPTQTQGEPVMIVSAETGQVTQSGDALLVARYLFKRAGY